MTSKNDEKVFCFRGRAPGPNGGALVVVERTHNHIVGDVGLTAGVSICAVTDRWSRERGYEFAKARLRNDTTMAKRKNGWRFTTYPKGLGVREDWHNAAYILARHALHHAFLFRGTSLLTTRFFRRQLPWVVSGVGLPPNGKITVG